MDRHGLHMGRDNIWFATSSPKMRSCFGSQRRFRPRRRLILPRWPMLIERYACSMGAIGSWREITPSMKFRWCHSGIAEAVPGGEEALKFARDRSPDLVLVISAMLF